MMREVNFARDVIYGIAHLMGVDTEEDLLKDHARGWASSVNNHVRRGWGFWPWPEFEVTEERAFRQVFYTDVTYQAGQGENSEVYYPATEKYYRMTGANAAAGTLPTDATKWAEIAAADFERYLAFSQYGKQDIDRVIAVSAPADSPDGERDTGRAYYFQPSGRGIDVEVSGLATVMVTYIPRAPEFTTGTYRTDRTYERGELVLDLASGDCYRALAAGTNQALTLPAYWLRQQFPYVLSEYVKYAVAAEQAGDAQQKAQWASEAEDRLKSEVDKLIAQGQLSFYGRGMKIPPKPFGVSWDYFRAYWGSAFAG